MNYDRSKFVYSTLMSGKSLTSQDVPNLSDTLANLKRKGIKFSSERLGYSKGKMNRYFMSSDDMAINLQNQK